MGILDGKVAIITGSGQGVGFEIAKAMAVEGAKIVTNNRKPGSSLFAMEESTLELTEEEKKNLESVSGDAKTAADFINKNGGEAVPFFGNVKDSEVAKACVQTAIDNFGRIDIVVNNAVSTWVGSIEKMTEKEWHILVDTKLNGSYYMTQHALPYMLEQKYGRFLNASSIGFLGLQGMSAYGAACAGIWSFTRAAAQDLLGTGITVNSYTPNARTRSWISMLATYRSQGVPADAIEEGAPDAMKYTADIFAPFFAYLSSPLADDITGMQFETGADGQIGLWSDPEIHKDIRNELGVPWTLEQLKEQVPELITRTVENNTSIELH